MAAGVVCYPAAASGSRPCRPNPSVASRRQLPFQESLYDAPMPPLKGEVPAARAEGFIKADPEGFNLWPSGSSIEPAAGRTGRCPSRQRRHAFSGEARKTEDPSRFNVWRLGSCAIRRKQAGVGPADRRQAELGAARVGSADMSFPGKPGKPKTPAALMYGGWGRVLSGGSKRVSALPTGGSGCVQAQPAGSKWQSALPTGFSRRAGCACGAGPRPTGGYRG